MSAPDLRRRGTDLKLVIDLKEAGSSSQVVATTDTLIESAFPRQMAGVHLRLGDLRIDDERRYGFRSQGRISLSNRAFDLGRKIEPVRRVFSHLPAAGGAVALLILALASMKAISTPSDVDKRLSASSLSTVSVNAVDGVASISAQSGLLTSCSSYAITIVSNNGLAQSDQVSNRTSILHPTESEPSDPHLSIGDWVTVEAQRHQGIAVTSAIRVSPARVTSSAVPLRSEATCASECTETPT